LQKSHWPIRGKLASNYEALAAFLLAGEMVRALSGVCGVEKKQERPCVARWMMKWREHHIGQQLGHNYEKVDVGCVIGPHLFLRSAPDEN